MITFLNDKTLRFGVFFMLNKKGLTILAILKSFLNQVEYKECVCTRFRNDCDTEYDNYEMYTFRLTKGII